MIQQPWTSTSTAVVFWAGMAEFVRVGMNGSMTMVLRDGTEMRMKNQNVVCSFTRLVIISTNSLTCAAGSLA